MKKLLAPLLILICFLTLAGCKNASELPFVKVSDIRSLQYEIVMHKENNPVPLLPSNTKDKVIIEKITSWMGQAKSEGFDNQVPTQSIPPNFLTIKLTNGSTYRLSPGGNNDIVYVQIVDTNKTLRLRSSDLNTWLWNGWEKDIHNTKTDDIPKELSFFPISEKNVSIIKVWGRGVDGREATSEETQNILKWVNSVKHFDKEENLPGERKAPMSEIKIYLKTNQEVSIHRWGKNLEINWSYQFAQTDLEKFLDGLASPTLK
jgi:hypothetical protein